MNKHQLAHKHNFLNESIFKLKSYGLIAKRYLKNKVHHTKKFSKGSQLSHEPIIAISESDLWNPFDNHENWILTAGKIENLRIAARKLNGLEIKAKHIFSFWEHIGNPNWGQGFVVGREIREGCIIPTIAGGLCQLSNALYDAALKANFQIVERHKHSKVVRGSLAEKDRDATVKWNYIDLRFKSDQDFRIEIELKHDKLIVLFKSKKANQTFNIQNPDHDFDSLNDCYSCGNIACMKHVNKNTSKNAITTFILDDVWTEFDNYITEIKTEKDLFILPLKENLLIKTGRYNWKSTHKNQIKYTTIAGIKRALKLRLIKGNPFELSLKFDREIAHSAAKLIPVECTHVVISQNLLPFIYETGALGGRTFDVLMTRLPLEMIHRRLDWAHSIHTQSLTLNDFRAQETLIKQEQNALLNASKIITAHSEIASLFPNKKLKLNWEIISSEKTKNKGNKILFPASALARKGAYEIKKLAQELNLELLILGNKTEYENFWEDVKVERFYNNFEDVKAIIYPTYIENHPHQILKLIPKGIPIITTTACGIEKRENLRVIETGNYTELLESAKEILNEKDKVNDRF